MGSMPRDLLFSPFKLGSTELSSRVVMAPMTRSRSPGNVPDDPVATKAVHDKGGHIFVQLMHTGRVGVKQNLPAGARVLGPSAITAPGEMWTDAEGRQKLLPPEEMTAADIEAAVREHGDSAAKAKLAGFDGVELHGANGYLIEQFLNVASNTRTDAYGGSVDNRIRFALAAVDAVIAAIGASQTGIRISPYGVFNGSASDPDTDAVYVALATALAARKIAYIRFVDHTSMGAPSPKPELYAQIRKVFTGAVILSGGYTTADAAEKALEEKRGDVVAFGRAFLANPTLPAKLKTDAKLTEVDMTTFYTPGPTGYTDYPA